MNKARKQLEKTIDDLCSENKLEKPRMYTIDPMDTGQKSEVGIVWKNPEFRGAARIALKNPDGDIMPSEVARITTLDLSDKNITAIDDIKYFTGLTNLNFLSSNTITDISALAALTSNLSTLKLGNNKISNISALSGLVNLIIVDLRFNEDITDWASVKHVTTVHGRPDYVWSTEEPALVNGIYQISKAENLAWMAAQGASKRSKHWYGKCNWSQ